MTPKNLLLKISRNNKISIGLIIIFIFIIIALFAPFITKSLHTDPYVIYSQNRLEAISKNHIFGTDYLGRDIFARVIYGTRISFSVSLSVGIISTLIGMIIGLFSGYYGGKFDLFIMRSIDVIVSFPWVIIALLMVSIIGKSLMTVIMALIIVYIPGMVRVVRGKTLSVKEERYVKAAQALNESNLSVMFKYILPNSMGPIIVQATLTMSWAILGEAGISYLGFGAQPPTPSWGLMLSSSTEYLYNAPLSMIIIPGLFLFLMVIGLNFLGDGLRDLLDPKLNNI